MASQPLVQGPLFGAPVSRFDFTKREFVKTPTPSPETSPEKEDATRVEVDLAALGIHGEPHKMVGETGARDKAKHTAAASCSDIVSPVGARDKEEAIRGEYDPFDFFDVLDMLGQEGIGIDNSEDLTGGEPKPKAKAVVKKHPVGCRQRNVTRRRVCPSIDMDLSKVRDPEIRAYRSSFKEHLDKQRDEAESNRLAYLKNAV